MAVVADKIGKLLVDAKLITEQQLNEALATVKASKGTSRLGSTLVKMGYVPEEKLLAFLAQQYRVPAVDLKMYQNIDPAIIKLVPLELVKKHMVLPLRRVGATLTVAMLDPTNIFALDDLKFRTNYTIEPVIAAETALIETIKKYYGGAAASAPDTAGANKSILQAKDYTISDTPDGDDLSNLGQAQEGPIVDVEDFDKTVGDALDSVEVAETDQQDGMITGEVEAPIIKLVNGILVNAMKVGASDIHIEPYETVFRIRYRVDGDLQTVMNLPLKVKNAIISRIKIMAKLDIAERRLPQDGRIKLKLGPKKDIDFRVSVLPTLFGEKGCLRLLDKSNIQVDKDKLGFDTKQAADLNAALAAPYGMLLVTGPTGSGKTVTLYSCLQAVNTVDVNISTAEDPVEFNFMGINQVLVQPDIGLTFPAALKSFLRQDPDIILIGEIRDFETGEIAVKAAMTGHLVMASLHTNDAPATISRLLQMGIEPFMVSTAVILIIAQRLAKRVCSGCKEPDPSATPEIFKSLGMKDAEIATAKPMKGKGCEKCQNKGYKGRVAFYQLMPITEVLRGAIVQGRTTDELKKIAIEDGVKSIRMSGLSKVAEGITTIEEVEGASVAD